MRCNTKMRSHKSRARAAAAAVLLSLLFGTAVGAAAESSGSYLYDEQGRAVAAPEAAVLSRSFTGDEAGAFRSPGDLFLTEDALYVADSGNARVVVLDRQTGAPRRTLTGAVGEDGTLLPFVKPVGLHVTAAGEIFVADSEAAAVLWLDAQGRLIRRLEQPTADTLPEGMYFKPTKVSVDAAGRIFVVSEGFNMGLLEFDQQGRFLRSMGAPAVAVSAVELLWRRLMTKEQRARTVANVPTEYSNVTADDEGFLFVTTSAYEYWQFRQGKIRPLRRLNAKGSDVLGQSDAPIGDQAYPESATHGATYYGPSTLVDVCLLPSGCYAVLDQKRGRVFAYTSDGDLMYVFGGSGDRRGALSLPTAIAYDDGDFYIADAGRGEILRFSLTEYGRLFSAVAEARAAIDCEREGALWEQILQENANCTLAVRGLGLAAYRRQEMRQAMTYFRRANDREDWSKAFAFVRRAWIEDHAVLLLVIVAAAVAAARLLSRLRRRAAETAPKGSLRAALLYAGRVSVHPLSGFWDLKRERRGSLPAALLLFSAACGVTVLSAVCTGFLFNQNDRQSYDLFGTLAYLAVGFLLWCISQWSVTALLDGEGTFGDIVTATGYACTPYIALQLLGLLCSNVMIRAEGDLHTVILTLSYLWLVALLILGMKQTHDMSMAKTFLVLLIMLVAILLIVFVAMLLLALYQQMGAFIRDLYDEIVLRL